MAWNCNKTFFAAIALLAVSATVGCQKVGSSSNVEADVQTYVYLDSTFEVQEWTNMDYGRGLRHAAWGNAEPSGTESLYLDLYLPLNDPNQSKPVLVLFHGGGFGGGSKSDPQWKEFARYFASRGWAVASVDYRLKRHKGTLPPVWNSAAESIENQGKRKSYQAMYPAVRDAKAAIRFLKSQAPNWNLDTTKFSALGASAGGVLATALAIAPDPLFVSECSPSEDSTLLSTHLAESANVHAAVSLWGGPHAIEFANDVDQKEYYSTSMAPILIIHGMEDEVIPHSFATELREQYTTHAVPVELHLLPNHGHGAWSAEIHGKSIAETVSTFLTQQLHLPTK